MIYLITGQKELFTEETVYKHASLLDCINYIEPLEEICLDSETTGFDHHKEEMICLQLGDEHNQYLIDTKTVNISPLKPILENKKIVGQNLKFDIKFCFKKGIILRYIFDTMIAERVLFAGFPDRKANLGALVQEYCGKTIDKSMQSEISKVGLTTRAIQYSAGDLIYLPEIKRKQLEELKKKDLLGVINLENRFTPVLAYIEHCGFKLDVKKWKKKMEGDNIKLHECQKALDQWVIERNMNKYIKQQLDLFSDELICKINWSSSDQVIQLFEELGVDCTTFDKGKHKKSVEASVINKFEHEFPIIKLYLAYKKAQKVVGTYGQSFIDQINKSTGRIHTKYTQIMDTGRISSGGTDKANKQKFINFQNIPSDKETRACFVAEEGNILLISDYSGQEQVVLANFSMDRNLLDFYDKGLSDMHCFIASKMYPELEGMTVEEIKSKHKEKRQAAKIAGFAINYGGVGDTIADQLHVPKEIGKIIYEAYFKAFPDLRKYFDEKKQQGLRDGFILISPLTRRKCYIPFFDQYKELRDKINEEFWEEYGEEREKNSPRFKELKSVISKQFRMKGDIERMTLNYPIQGSSAEITKISCVYIFDYIYENNLFDIVKFVNTVHDENVIECPIPMQNEIAAMVEDAMNRAGDLFCKRVPLRAVPEASVFWKK